MFLKSVYMCLWYDMCVYIYLFTYIHTHIYHVLWACACVYMYDCRWQNQCWLSSSISLFFLSVLNIYYWVFCRLHICVYMHAWCPLKPEEGRMVDPLELELQVAMSHRIGYWELNPTGRAFPSVPFFFCFCFFLLNCSFSPPFFFLINRFYFNFCTIYFVHIPCPL